MTRGPRLSILLLTEDSGSDSHDTLQALAKEMLKLVDAQTRTQRGVIDFPPLNEQAREAMNANLWKSTNERHHRAQVDLRRAIANTLMEKSGFVLIHIDGDRPWGARHTSENADKFRKLIVEKVEELLKGNLRKRGLPEAELPKQVSAHLSRLFCAMPHYSIESWLYQNTYLARQLCHAHHQGKDAERFEAWEADRGALDEEDKPKEKVCFGARYNLQLASQYFPADKVLEVGKSFTATVEALKASSALREALASTYAGGAE